MHLTTPIEQRLQCLISKLIVNLRVKVFKAKQFLKVAHVRASKAKRPAKDLKATNFVVCALVGSGAFWKKDSTLTDVSA